MKSRDKVLKKLAKNIAWAEMGFTSPVEKQSVLDSIEDYHLTLEEMLIVDELVQEIMEEDSNNDR